jgi:hypothetical protein
MDAPEEGDPGPDNGGPPEGAWRHLQTCLTVFGAILFGLGGLGLFWACGVFPHLGFGAEGPGLLLVLLTWRLFPLLPGALLLLGPAALRNQTGKRAPRSPWRRGGVPLMLSSYLGDQGGSWPCSERRPMRRWRRGSAVHPRAWGRSGASWASPPSATGASGRTARDRQR